MGTQEREHLFQIKGYVKCLLKRILMLVNFIQEDIMGREECFKRRKEYVHACRHRGGRTRHECFLLSQYLPEVVSQS